MSDVLELWRQHRVGQDKYTYFLLAVCASAVAFAVQKTEGLSLSLDLLPVALAVLAWGLSFYCGCQNIGWVQVVLYDNQTLSQLNEGSHPHPPPSQLLDSAKESVRTSLRSSARKAQVFAIWQFRLLIAGAVLFIGWHIWRLYLNSF